MAGSVASVYIYLHHLVFPIILKKGIRHDVLSSLGVAIQGHLFFNLPYCVFLSLFGRQKKRILCCQAVSSALDFAVVTGKLVDFLCPLCGYSAAKMVPDFLFVITLSSVMSFPKAEYG